MLSIGNLKMRNTHFTGKSNTAQDALRVTHYKRTIQRMGIGKKIKQFREARRLTLAEVEARAGLSDGNLSRIERGKQWITEEKLNSLAAVLGVRTHELFIDEDASPPQQVEAADVKSPISLDQDALEWLELRKYLGSDDIGEFKALIKSRQERNVRLLDELEGRQHRSEGPRSSQLQVEGTFGAKKQSSQSS